MDDIMKFFLARGLGTKLAINIHKKMTFSKQGLVNVKQKTIQKFSILWLKLMESVRFS